MADLPDLRSQLRRFALGLPGANEDFPWGERVVKVNQKVFVFLGPDDVAEPGMELKLAESNLQALTGSRGSPTF